MSIEKLINDWVSLDNKLKHMNNEINSIREKKNNICQKKIINISDGNLKFIQTKQYNTLTFKHLEICLHKFINNKDDVKTIIQYVKDTRKKKIIYDIKRSYN